MPSDSETNHGSKRGAQGYLLLSCSTTRACAAVESDWVDIVAVSAAAIYISFRKDKAAQQRGHGSSIDPSAVRREKECSSLMYSSPPHQRAAHRRDHTCSCPDLASPSTSSSSPALKHGKHPHVAFTRPWIKAANARRIRILGYGPPQAAPGDKRTRGCVASSIHP